MYKFSILASKVHHTAQTLNMTHYIHKYKHAHVFYFIFFIGFAIISFFVPERRFTSRRFPSVFIYQILKKKTHKSHLKKITIIEKTHSIRDARDGDIWSTTQWESLYTRDNSI